MDWDITKISPAEATGWNLDRLVTVEIKTAGRPGRCLIFPLYEAAVAAVGNRPLSLVGAETIVGKVNPGDNAFLMTGMGALPFMPRGETDGPPGIASLARAISFGRKALPIIITTPRDMEPVTGAVRAAGLGVLDYEEAKLTTTRCAVIIPFEDCGEKAIETAKRMMDLYEPKVLASCEMFGPNRKGVFHFGTGLALEDYGNTFPNVDSFFNEAAARNIPTISCLDVGNEMGAGTIEETVRKVVPYADECRCACGSGFACSVKSDVPFACSISNWGAYAITAMVGYLIGDTNILQDEEMEKRVLEATAMAGSADGCLGAALASNDGVPWDTQQGLIKMMRTIVEQGLSGFGIAGQLEKK